MNHAEFRDWIDIIIGLQAIAGLMMLSFNVLSACILLFGAWFTYVRTRYRLGLLFSPSFWKSGYTELHK